jgi:predicted HAD superfamily phosphohydrolase YqeG
MYSKGLNNFFLNNVFIKLCFEKRKMRNGMIFFDIDNTLVDYSASEKKQ